MTEESDEVEHVIKEYVTEIKEEITKGNWKIFLAEMLTKYFKICGFHLKHFWREICSFKTLY